MGEEKGRDVRAAQPVGQGRGSRRRERVGKEGRERDRQRLSTRGQATHRATVEGGAKGAASGEKTELRASESPSACATDPNLNLVGAGRTSADATVADGCKIERYAARGEPRWAPMRGDIRMNMERRAVRGRGAQFLCTGPSGLQLGSPHVSGAVDAASVPTHMQARSPRLAKARQGMAGMAWHGMVWVGMLVTYHLCHFMDPIYSQKGATCPRESFWCTYVLVTAYFC